MSCIPDGKRSYVVHVCRVGGETRVLLTLLVKFNFLNRDAKSRGSGISLFNYPSKGYPLEGYLSKGYPLLAGVVEILYEDVALRGLTNIIRRVQ